MVIIGRFQQEIERQNDEIKAQDSDLKFPVLTEEEEKKVKDEKKEREDKKKEKQKKNDLKTPNEITVH